MFQVANLPRSRRGYQCDGSYCTSDEGILILKLYKISPPPVVWRWEGGMSGKLMAFQVKLIQGFPNFKEQYITITGIF